LRQSENWPVTGKKSGKWPVTGGSGLSRENFQEVTCHGEKIRKGVCHGKRPVTGKKSHEVKLTWREEEDEEIGRENVGTMSARCAMSSQMYRQPAKYGCKTNCNMLLKTDFFLRRREEEEEQTWLQKGRLKICSPIMFMHRSVE
jgi:hypothetical protein